MENNKQIIDELIELYQNAEDNDFRNLIAKHFIPSDKEKYDNGEISTPVTLVDEMLDKMPKSLFQSINKVLEPCCGKGNFILGIFERFYKGLYNKYEDKCLLCRDIIEKCLYFGDKGCNNVFLTQQILICQAEIKTGTRETNYNFNSFVGDTLNNSLNELWSHNYFEAIIGNPPYSTDPTKPNSKPLYDKFIMKYIDICDYLLFVVPSRDGLMVEKV